MKLIEYLKRTKDAIKAIKPGIFIHIVLGNESCDLDSMVSSIVLAFHYSTLDKYNNSLVVPLINKTEKLFPIKVENVYLLNKYDIPLECIVFKDSLDLKTLQKDCKLSVTLVDHHVLSSDTRFLKESVVELIDHRPTDPSEIWNDNVDKDIQLVGSCASLIASHINYQESSSRAIEMLLDVIAFDTIAFSEEAGKVKPLDFKAAELLEKTLNEDPNSQKERRTKRFNEIYDAHRNISKLTSEQLLYKDLKVVGSLWIPGLPMLVKTYLKRSDVFEAIQKFQEDNKAETLLLMGIEVTDGEVARDLAICTQCEELAQKIEDVLLLQFEVTKTEEALNRCSSCLHYYTQNNTKLSRKQLIPLLKTVLE